MTHSLPNYLQQPAYQYKLAKIRRKPRLAVPPVYGAAQVLMDYSGHEFILHGPYETGKTYAALWKLHHLLWTHAGAQGLMVRQTYKSLVNSACVIFEKKVLNPPPDMPNAPVQKYGGERPDFYIYPNGARLWVGGLDKPDKFLSAEFDYIYVNQAEEITLDSWEKLIGRATGRAGHTDQPMVIGDCNPADPGHWILQRASEGTLALHQQMHEHNPVLFDQRTGQMTDQGIATMATLDALTGIRYQRGRRGLWVAAEGVIYDNFSIAHNVTEEAEYNPDWNVVWGVDDGYAHGQGPGTASYHPRVFLLGQVTPVGGLHVFYEYYRTQELSERSIANVLELPYKLPDIAHVDSSAAELKARLWESGMTTMGATHPVSEGIKNLRRMMCDGQEVRLIKIHPRCSSLIRELQSYRYDENSKVSNVGERKPNKIDDHGPDALRYMAWSLRYG